MNTKLYFRNHDRKIIATAGQCSYIATTAHEAIHGLCGLVEQKYNSEVAGEILTHLRNLYARIVDVVLRNDKSKTPKIWNHDCNAHANNIAIST